MNEYFVWTKIQLLFDECYWTMDMKFTDNMGNKTYFTHQDC